MSFINDVCIVGELIEDANVNKSTKLATLKVKTGRPIKNAQNKTEWQFQTHTVKCYKDTAFNMLETKAKRGRWVKVMGELMYNNNQTEILVRKTTGDIGMMFTTLGLQQPDDSTPESHNQNEVSNNTGNASNGFLGKNNSQDEDDEIPF